MKQKKLVIVLLAGGLLALSSLPLLSQARGGRAPRGHGFAPRTHFRGHMFQRNLFTASILLNLQDEIGLTEEQVKRIQNLRTDFNKEKIRYESESRLLQLELRNSMDSDSVNRKMVESLIRKIGELETTRQIDSVNHFLELKSILTEAQIQKIRDFRRDRRRKHWTPRPDYRRNRRTPSYHTR